MESRVNECDSDKDDVATTLSSNPATGALASEDVDLGNALTALEGNVGNLATSIENLTTLRVKLDTQKPRQEALR